MGGFVDFRCPGCKYEERRLGFGRGRHEFPFLALFRCDNCRSIGSTWVYENKIPVCGYCYHQELRILDPNEPAVHCPKCGELARLTRLDETWE